MRSKIYHVGLSKRGKTLVIEARRNVDHLSTDIYDYLGQRETTKESLRKNRRAILALAKKNNPRVYGELQFAVVE